MTTTSSRALRHRRITTALLWAACLLWFFGTALVLAVAHGALNANP